MEIEIKAVEISNQKRVVIIYDVLENDEVRTENYLINRISFKFLDIETIFDSLKSLIGKKYPSDKYHATIIRQKAYAILEPIHEKNKYSPLITAVKKKDIEAIKILLKESRDAINKKSPNGDHALIVAMRIALKTKDWEIAELLFDFMRPPKTFKSKDEVLNHFDVSRDSQNHTPEKQNSTKSIAIERKIITLMVERGPIIRITHVA